MPNKSKKYILWFSEISSKDVPLVGGKNASLGEMYSQLTKKGINIPDGFCTTSFAYRYFLEKNKILPKLKEIFKNLKPVDIKKIQTAGREARALILDGNFPADFEKEIVASYKKLEKEYGSAHSTSSVQAGSPQAGKNLDVAVRSSGTLEDIEAASFAGQHESYLNVRGEKQLLQAIKKCMASLFTDRVISYRAAHSFSHMDIALSVGVQKMVRSDLASSGVIFTLDTETGFKDVVLINGSFGLGEMIVKGRIIPDEFYVCKPTLKQGYPAIISKKLGKKNQKLIYKSGGGIQKITIPKNDQERFVLSDEEILKLANWAIIIEDHYSKKAKKWLPQDIEWAKDGKTGELFVVQSRPETVHTSKKELVYKEYELQTKKPKILLEGIAVGEKIGAGKVHIIRDVRKITEFQKGEVLVVPLTSPDWEPAMKLASAIITDLGGKTSHAAIVSRELGVPCIVGTQKATKVLKNGQIVTVDCSQGATGRILSGATPFVIKEFKIKEIPKLKTKIMVNLGEPNLAFKTSFLPTDGVGLAREEFIIAEKIKVHPLALYHYDRLKVKDLRFKINKITSEYKDKKEYFIKELAEGIAQIAAAFWPREVIVRFSDFKTNEYRNLIGGELFEKEEENPMLGFRGASRYLDKEFQPAFQMECQAIKRVRDVFGLKNVSVMVPFCRTPEEGKAVLNLMQKFGLARPDAERRGGQVSVNQRNLRGKSASPDLKVYVMAEIPSNIILADQFSKIFDSYSVGSNDLTQLLLGVDRDNAKIAQIFDESNEAVKRAIEEFIKKAHRYGKKVSICGEAPATVVGFVEFLIKCGVDSISVNPDSVIKTMLLTSGIEEKLKK